MSAHNDRNARNGFGWTSLMFVGNFTSTLTILKILLEVGAEVTDSAWGLVRENKSLHERAVYREVNQRR